jgi:2-dehydro-3-deoxyphosphogluconate aldolase/(4S)-4-hydroxy-2-oxoglutarate aldolase
LTRVGIVPVVVLEDPEAANPLADALVQGGVPCVEITLRTPAGILGLEALRDRTDILAGAGTVLTVQDVDRAAVAGAGFIVSPGFAPDVVARSQELGLTVIPGISSATELQAAVAAGLRHVKLFPAEIIGGLQLLKALASPFPGVEFMPSGGLTLQNMTSYLEHPAVFAVGGSWMVPQDAIASGRFSDVARLCAEARDVVLVMEERN